MTVERFDPARLRGLRLARGWTQEDLAEASGVVRPAISAYEVGKRQPTTRVVKKLAMALDFDAEDLMMKFRITV